MFSKIISLVFFILISFLMVSCYLPPNEFVDENPGIVSKYSIEDLKNGAFKGGGIINSDDYPGTDQLVEGMEIPFRLSAIPTNARRSRSEYDEKVNYGYLTVKSILKNALVLEFVLLDDNGMIQNSGSDFYLDMENSLDINRDGIEDICYESYSGFLTNASLMYSSVSAEKRIDENANNINGSYILKFSDPRENGNGCSFRLLESNYEGDSYPSGILNMNPNGALVVNSRNYTLYDEITPTATQVAYNTQGLPALVKGDFILDMQNERFRKIINDPEYGSDYVVFESTDTTIDEAFIVFDLQYDKPVTVFLNGDEVNKSRLNWSKEFDKTLWEKEAHTAHGTLTQTLQATGNVAIDVTLHASFHAGIKWHWWPPHPSIKLECSVGIDFNFDHHFYLNYKAVYDYFKNWEDTLFDETDTIIVEGVPINLRAVGKIGMDLTAHAEADIWTGYRLNGGLSAGVGYKLGDGFNSDFNHSLSFTRYGPEARAKGTIDLKPYFDLKLALGVAYIAWVESDTIPYLEGVVEGNAGIFLDDDYKLKPEDMWIDFNVYGGLEQDITLRLGYKWISVHKTFELYKHRWPIWDIEFKWPRAPEDFGITPEYRKAILNWRDMSKVESGYKIYKKKYPESDYNNIYTTGPNVQQYTFNGNEDADFQVKAFYHVKHLDFDMYQILAPQTKSLIACPERMTGIPTNGNPFLIWNDISIKNNGYEVYIEKDGEFDFTPVATQLSGDSTSLYYIMPQNMDSQFKSRAYYIPEGKGFDDALYSAWSNVYQWLAIPSGLAGFPYDDGEILLRWQNNSHKSQGYELWYQKYGLPETVLRLTDPSTTSHVMEKEGGESWDKFDVLFKIRNYIYDTTLATDTYSGWSNSFQWIAAPSDFSIERIYDNNILTWTDNSHVESGYEIWKLLNTGHSYQTGKTGENIEKYLDKPDGEFANEEFAYKIRAYKSEENVTGYSDWSDLIIHNFRDPSELSGVLDGSGNQIKLSWKINSYFANKTYIYSRKNGEIDFSFAGEADGKVNNADIVYTAGDKVEIIIRSVYLDKDGNKQYSGYSNVVKIGY